MSKGVVDYSIHCHGIEHEQYFQGAGVAFSSWDECFTGIGDTTEEAYQDALEIMAQSDWCVDFMPHESGMNPISVPAEDEWERGEDWTACHVYVTIYVRGAKRDLCPLCGEDRNHPSQHGKHACTR